MIRQIYTGMQQKNVEEKINIVKTLIKSEDKV